MSKLSKKVRLVIAGLLLALTSFATGLTMSVVFNASASNTASNTSAVLPAAAGDDLALMMNSDESDFDMQDMMMQVANAPDGFDFMAAPFAANSAPATQGIISKIDGAKILLNKDSRTVNTNDQTTFGDANGTLKLSDLAVGDRVMALGKIETDKSLTARWVLRLPALPTVERGTISSVDATAKQFKFKVGNDEWTATISDTTKITKDGKTAALTDLAANDKVTVSGKADTTAKTIAAQNVVVGKPVAANHNALRGTVKSADATANTLVVTVKAKDGSTSDVTVKTDGNTKFIGQNFKGLGDLKAGDNVAVIGTKQSDGTVTATLVTKLPAAGTGPGNRGAGPGSRSMPGNRGFGGNTTAPDTTN